MDLAIFFLAVAVVWLIFRKSIVLLQARVAAEFFRRESVPDSKVVALEKVGIAFCVLLIAAALAIILTNVMTKA